MIERYINNGKLSPISLCVGQETSRNRSASGKAAPAGDPAAKGGQEPFGNDPCRKHVGKFGLRPAPDVLSQRFVGTAPQTDSWPSLQTLRVSEKQGVPGRWVSDRIYGYSNEWPR